MTSNVSLQGNEIALPVMDEKEKKKLRNRLSQRAFRRRQAEQIRELQSRVNVSQKTESEAIAALQRENNLLRSQLVEVHARMSRLLSTIQTLTGSVSKVLDETSSHAVLNEETENGAPNDGPRDRIQAPILLDGPRQYEQRPSSETSRISSRLRNSRLATDTEETELLSMANAPTPGALTSLSQSNVDDSLLALEPFSFNTPPQQIPNIWTFEYQMGPAPYTDALSASQDSSIMRGQEWTESNSPFSDHIKMLQYLLKSKLGQLSLVVESHSKPLYQAISIVLSMFNSITRPDVMVWYAQTRFYHIIELTAWEMFPSSATFEKLHERYRPTEAQLHHPHPQVIDWIPFPSIRSRLIRFHAANPRIDQIFCDAVSGYVVETLMSDLIANAPPIKAYVRVTDLISSMGSSEAGDDADGFATLPAPDAASLFQSPSYARVVFHRLNMDRGASYYKIDPAFFGKYPELYDPTDDIAATGVPLKPDLQIRLSYPKPLDSTIIGTYRSFIDFSLNALMEMFPLF